MVHWKNFKQDNGSQRMISVFTGLANNVSLFLASPRANFVGSMDPSAFLPY